MTTKEKIAVMQAWVDGKKIEWKDRISGNLFVELNYKEDPEWNWFEYEYRIKSEPKFRPWTAEEAIGKVVKQKDCCAFCLITFTKDNLVFGTDSCNPITVQDLLDNYVQLDGSPCGVKEDA